MTLEQANSSLTSAPADSPIGWYIVGALFVCTFSVFGVSIYSFIILTTPMSQDNGWNAVQTGSLVSAMWLVAPLALFSGVLNKLSNPWRLIAAGVLMQAVVLIFMTIVTEFWQLYALRIIMGLGKVMALAAAPMIIAKSFSSRFATAMAIVWAGGAAGGIVMSPLTESLISMMSWQMAATIISAGLTLVAMSALLAERSLSPPLKQTSNSDHGTDATPDSLSLTSVIRQISVLRAAASIIAVTGAGMAAIAVLAQQPKFLNEAGLPVSAAAIILGITAVGCFFGSGTIGWCLDNFHGAVSSLLVSVSVLLGLFTLGLLGQGTPSVETGIIGAICLGYGIGAGEVLWITITKRQFGTLLFPYTYGGWYFSLQLGYALGGGLGGWGLEHYGGSGFLVFVGILYLPAAVISLVLSKTPLESD